MEGRWQACWKWRAHLLVCSINTYWLGSLQASSHSRAQCFFCRFFLSLHCHLLHPFIQQIPSELDTPPHAAENTRTLKTRPSLKGFAIVRETTMGLRKVWTQQNYLQIPMPTTVSSSRNSCYNNQKYPNAFNTTISLWGQSCVLVIFTSLIPSMPCTSTSIPKYLWSTYHSHIPH